MKNRKQNKLIDALIKDLFSEVDEKMDQNINNCGDCKKCSEDKRGCSIIAKIDSDGEGKVTVEGNQEDLIRLTYQIIYGLSKGMEVPFDEIIIEILKEEIRRSDCY